MIRWIYIVTMFTLTLTFYDCHLKSLNCESSHKEWVKSKLYEGYFCNRNDAFKMYKHCEKLTSPNDPINDYLKSKVRYYAKIDSMLVWPHEFDSINRKIQNQ
jgi:hypothetical protein